MTITEAAPTFHLGDRLSKALDVAGLGVGDMADVLDVRRQTVGNYLHGRTTPNLATVRVWADETGVPLEWLLGDDHCSECGSKQGMTCSLHNATSDGQMMLDLSAATPPRWSFRWHSLAA